VVDVWRVVSAGLILFCLSGCGRSTPSPAQHTRAAAYYEPGAFVGQCGSIGDAAVSAQLTGAQQVAANPLRCRWNGTAGTVVFEWYRGSPVDGHQPSLAAAGASRPITVASRHGLSWTSPDGCEAAVSSGGDDFVTWQVTGAPDPCVVATRLAELTLRKAGI
jgi:hypothetical protein